MADLLSLTFQDYLNEKMTLTCAWGNFRQENIGVHKTFSNFLLQYWGIYRIHNIHDNKYYIGSSTELVKRLTYHNTGLFENTAYK